MARLADVADPNPLVSTRTEGLKKYVPKLRAKQIMQRYNGVIRETWQGVMFKALG